MFDQPLPVDVRVRLLAWQDAMGDAVRYIAVAQGRNDFLIPNATVVSETGRANVDWLVERGMIAAAIISACQFSTTGEGGPGIAGNRERDLEAIRDALLRFSDEDNQWAEGRTRQVLEEARQERHRRIAHFDGRHANIEGIGPPGLSFSWAGPNPSYRSESFTDLRHAASAIYRRLRQIEFAQHRLTSRNENDQ